MGSHGGEFDSLYFPGRCSHRECWMVDTILLMMATSAISMNNSRYINNQSLFGNRNRQSQKKNVKILPVSGVLSVVVIGEPKIHSFYSTHNQAKGPLLAWFQDAKKAKWKSPQDIKIRSAHASILSDNLVVFTIG